MDELYLKRKIDDYLILWKENIHKNPLVIKGPRQIGKTCSIRNFGLNKNNYESFIEINFIKEPKYKKIIEDGFDVNSIKKNISLIDPLKKFIDNKTLIFFDEITDFPEICTSLKFFKEDNRYDVICSGSLLGISYSRIESLSVGYKTDYEMFSLDFEEFLWANGFSNFQITDMENHILNLKPFNNLEMNLYHSLFLDYTILGGMPAVVKNYLEKESFENFNTIQKQLIQDYKEDIKKYAIGLDKTRILNVFNSIPLQLAKENKKFQLNKIEHGARYKDYRGCAEWLNDSGIIQTCYCLNNPSLPLNANYIQDKFKLYFSDTGLLISMLDEESQDDLRQNKNLGVYKGAIYENMVAEALYKSGFKLFYYRNDKGTIEEDFFIRNSSYLIPVEVKAKYGRTISLNALINSKDFNEIKFGIKLSYNNIGYENNIYTIPYFCTFLLKRTIKAFK